jgi:hypothetical protein
MQKRRRWDTDCLHFRSCHNFFKALASMGNLVGGGDRFCLIQISVIYHNRLGTGVSVESRNVDFLPEASAYHCHANCMLFRRGIGRRRHGSTSKTEIKGCWFFLDSQTTSGSKMLRKEMGKGIPISDTCSTYRHPYKRTEMTPHRPITEFLVIRLSHLKAKLL